jgi:hypothetical protein
MLGMVVGEDEEHVRPLRGVGERGGGGQAEDDRKNA